MLRLCNLSKKYGDIEVLKAVNLEVKPGEIHGLVGENGAGKSTLLGILFGRSDIRNSGGYCGDIYLEDKKVIVKNSSQAVKSGIGMVHQEFALIPNMTITENIVMGRENVFPLGEKIFGGSLAYVDKGENRIETETILKRLGINLDPDLKVLNLSVNLKHFIEFARETSKKDLKLLLLDEPTAALSREDAKKLLSVLSELASNGTAIIFVSHRLEEIVSICHRVTVFRDGEAVAVYELNNFSSDQQNTSIIKKIAISMVGHSVVEVSRKKRTGHHNLDKSVVMSFRDFGVDMPGEMIKNINLDIYLGEIIGIAGLSGHGKLALGNGVFGIYPSSGLVLLDNREIDTANTAEIINKGIYLLPDDRRYAGLLTERSILENIIFTAVQQKNAFLKPFFYKGLSFIDGKKSSAYTDQCIKKFDIRCQDVKQKVGLLSGGNQQKVCLARAVTMRPSILFVAEPTRGVDIGAKEIILEILLNINQELGTTIILASSELGELKRVCDRIAVMYEGGIFGIFSPECDDLEFGLAFSGKRLTAEC